MKATIKNLQAQNAALSADRDRYQKSFFAEETKKAAANVNLSQEIATLQEKLADLTDAKSSLESSHKETVNRYQHLMDINVGQLRKKLVMAQGENQRIQAAITDLENKLQELETGETEKEKILQEQWQDKTQKEVLIYNQKLVELEELHSLEAQQLGAHIDELNTKLALKDNEILKLDGAIRDQCIKMQEEVLKIRKEMQQAADNSQKLLKKKITYLQRKLQKCEHLKDTIFKECEHKLYRVKTEKELEVKGLQLQMKMQYVSLSTVLAQGKNQEMEQAVAQLEAKYLDLLGNIKDSAWKQKENDQKRIAELEQELSTLRESMVFFKN